MRSKKGVEFPLAFIVVAAILLVFLVIYLGGWKALWSKQITGVNTALNGADDYDKDGTINLADKCPCVPGANENKGCPSDYKIVNVNEGKETKICPPK